MRGKGAVLSAVILAAAPALPQGVPAADEELQKKVDSLSVAPKGKALKCADCHGDKGRLDWKALGYKGDPRDPKNR